MNVTLPDGTVLEGIPEGTTKAQIVEKLQRSGRDVSGLVSAPEPTPAPSTAPASPEPTGWENVGRQLGLSARAGANVIASPLVSGGNMLNKAINVMGGNLSTNLQGTLDKGLNAIGLPEPRADRPIEQAAQSMAQSAPAVALPGRLLPQALGNAALASAQAPQGQEATGAAIGGASGAVGQGLSKIVGGLITPSAEAVKLLRDKVKLTPGQIQGGWLKAGEESLSQIPYVGGPMRNRIKEARNSWQQSVKDSITPPKSGPRDSENISSIQDSFTRAYEDSVNMAKFRPGTQPVKPSSELVAEAKKTTPTATEAQMKKANELIDNLMENDGKVHNAASLQKVESRLKSIAGDYKYSPGSGPEDTIYGELLEDAAANMRSQWRNSLTATKKAELEAIDSQYHKFKPVESAAGKGNAALVGEEDLPGSFTPQSLLKELRAGEKGTRKAEWFAGSRPLQETATAAERAIGSKLITPTNISRLVSLTSLAGSSSGLGTSPTLGILAAAAGYGTKPAQRLLTGKFATGGHEYQKYLADAIRKFSPTVAAESSKE